MSLSVEVTGVKKSFGFGRNKTNILQDVCLNVRKGSTYGLLGATGSGKTTLLRCIIGRIKPDSGKICTLGEEPGTIHSKIPGSNVGYMPQEYALFGDMTIQETMMYFGRIHNMSKSKIHDRTEFLITFLKLTTKKIYIKNLSGGQKRRVSFAIALLHEPPLLILDEPTVGVDSILRNDIWNHLLQISETNEVSCIVTTHYVEETRRANKIGFLRNGKLLAEDHPATFLNYYQKQTLEDVFLHLCVNDVSTENELVNYYAKDKVDETSVALLDNNPCTTPVNIKHQTKRLYWNWLPCWQRIFALFIKNLTKIIRNPTSLMFQFILPSIQIAVICMTFAQEPRNLQVAVVNEDNLWGVQFLSLIDNTTIHQVRVDNIKVALSMVSTGEAWGSIHIWKNFTNATIQRLSGTDHVIEDILTGSKIHVRLDTTEYQNAIMIKQKLYQAVQLFEEYLLNSINMDSSLAEFFLEFGEPVYGPNDPNLLQYIAPGAILFISYFMAVGLTAMEYTLERKEGLLDRSYVAGVTSLDVMFSHILTQMGTMVIQISLMLVTLIVVFKFPLEGSIFWITMLLLLQGFCGMIYGYFIAILLDEEYGIITLALGSLFPCLLLSGIIWPVEAMPQVLEKFSRLLPHTYAAKAMRSVFSRGQNISYVLVWRGYLMTLAWICIFLVLTLLVLKIRKK